MVVYEGMFILDPTKYARDPDGTSKLVTDLITEAGGTILAARLWDERKLAYPIKGHKKGAYWLTYFNMEGDGLATLDRKSQIVDEILRSLVLKVEPRIADALVEHALAGDGNQKTQAAEAT
ncbi:MAG: 30S ribosomal protein S6 [Pirellulales bacterium]